MSKLSSRQTIALLSHAHGLPTPVFEFRFDQSRRWRIDAAFDDTVAVEVEGGAFINGRHTRGSGYVKDLQKYNALTLQGWRLLRYTPSQIEAGHWVDDVRDALTLGVR